MNIPINIVAVGAGGALGSIGRFLVAVLSEKAHLHFPLGTFMANIVGCFCIGLLWSYFERIHISHEFRLFLFAGFLGGFTTFSAFTRETYSFFKVGEYFHAFSYMFLSNIVGFAMVALGFFISQRFLLR